MNDMNVKKPIPLPAAFVPAAYEDGLLKTADLNAPVAVQVEVWPAAETGYTVRLNLDGLPATEERVITATDKPGDILTLYLSENHLLKDKRYSLQYRIYSPIGESEDFSPAIPLIVDRTPPGAAVLAPLFFAEGSINGDANAILPGYAGMAIGDVVRTLCNGISGPTHTVQADELTVRPIEIVFEADYLLGLAAQEVTIEYVVVDRAGNPSFNSLPVTISLTM
ncbi:hypothetical protein [Pseudomonas sp. SLFW]|uniref:hypothetical protein n=1 Tax=Pseudomonas sp. SLFW TaxID=2683259 RepID=UPI00141257BD|nr:hypothetical protein [Pseudomonas sp. SLFW]NBB13382.1 hypothetical protein [Pseudomonas sp. SLFW]